LTKPNTGATSREKKHRDWHDWVATIGIPLTFAAATTAAIFTGMAACYTRSQWLTAVDNEHRTVRAYVALRDIAFAPRGESAFDLVPEWENNGNSETVNMTMHLNRLITKGGCPMVSIMGQKCLLFLGSSLYPTTVSHL
jgi:hypothetical protein